MTNTLNLFLPPQCLCCSARVSTHGTLCMGCWEQIRFITQPMCSCCGLPFSYAIVEDMLCANCLEEHPRFSAARAVFRFDDHSKTLIHQLKFQDETYLAKTLAGWMARSGAELIERADILIPVPLHKKRLIERRYNQSALLAQGLAKHTGKPVLVDALIKVKHTPAQSGLNRNDRAKNLRGAYTPNPKQLAAMQGKTVLLVDDVMTTGATAEACTKTLLEAGVNTVYILTLARVARDEVG